MAKRNKSLSNVGSILAVLGGAIEIAIGVLTLIGETLGGIVDIFNTANWVSSLGGGLESLIIAIILIVIGVISILLALGRFGLDWIILGIILIVLGVVGSGIGGLLVIIGGILFLIAGL
ncbi:MAG: hypothetical protein KGD64_09445 [Candidatus Heimdallarchaeota archaeon]|nr:hypothetical protein [Candidatus Heimdallarchaeota archaeon]